MPLISVEGLRTSFFTHAGVVRAVDGIDLAVERGEVVCVVGESGSGKTVAALSILGLVPDPPGRIVGGRVVFTDRDGERDLVGLSPRELRKVRGNRIAMIFQDPMTALNPYLAVGPQLTEVLALHRGMRGREATREAARMLGEVGLPAPETCLRQFPHELSGGMRQRVMIAMALLCEPALLIADEPTTALDVTVQAQILELILALKNKAGLAVLFITHDLGVVARIADRVAVMYAGKIVEEGSVFDVLERPAHPYTAALRRAVPSVTSDQPMREPALVCAAAPPSESVAATTGPTPLVVVEDLAVHFPVRGGLFARATQTVKAVDGVSFELGHAETLALVGESGCGKSTTARALLRLVRLSRGRVIIDGVDVAGLSGQRLRRARRSMQMIFQDPYASLDPRMTVLELVAEPLLVHRICKRTRDARPLVAQLIERVGLAQEHLHRYPHEFSGGQRQRIGIARALALGPKLVVADEPVSALDVSIRAQILNLMSELQRERGLSYLFIAHDLATVRRFADRVLVMYLGRIVESAPTHSLFATPAHPYTQALLAAVPSVEPAEERARRRLPLAGEPPSPLSVPQGCAFHPRCAHAFDRCRNERPELRKIRGSVVARSELAGAAIAGSVRVGAGVAGFGSERSQHEVACHLDEVAPP
ncbi:MAG: ABC transporter ATP-binding protein [Myxococcales bacterium]|nr:ABC transporter ATP-binding protein [Myxococcales bacterium]